MTEDKEEEGGGIDVEVEVDVEVGVGVETAREPILSRSTCELRVG